eukprot:g1584.t1
MASFNGNNNNSRRRSSFSAAMEFLASSKSSRNGSSDEEMNINNSSSSNFNNLPPDQMLSIMYEGFNSENRGDLWFHLSGANRLKANSDGDTYGKLIRKLDDTTTADDAEHVNSIKVAIENDLKRYKPDRLSTNPLYNPSNNNTKKKNKTSGVISFLSTNVGKLRRICLALALYIPDVGYNQAYLPIVRFVCRVTCFGEDDIFWFLAAFLSFTLPPYFSTDMIGVRTDQYILKQLVKRYFKNVKVHLECIEVDFGLLTYHWFVSSLVDQVSHEVLLRTWDMILLIGSHQIFIPMLFTISKMQDTIENYTTTKEVKDHFDSTLKSITVDEFNKASVLFYNTNAYILETRRISNETSSSKTLSPKSFISKLSSKNVLQKNDTITRNKMDNNDNAVVKKSAIKKSKEKRYKKIMKLNIQLDKINKNIQIVENKLHSMKQNKNKIELQLHEALVNDQNISVLEDH